MQHEHILQSEIRLVPVVTVLLDITVHDQVIEWHVQVDIPVMNEQAWKVNVTQQYQLHSIKIELQA